MLAAFPNQDDEERKEKEDITEDLDDGLPPGGQAPIEKIHAHMAFEIVAIGGAEHGIGAVNHVGELEGPGRGLDQHIAHGDIVADGRREQGDQQTRDLACPNTAPVDEAKNFFHTDLQGKRGGLSSHNVSRPWDDSPRACIPQTPIIISVGQVICLVIRPPPLAEGLL
jgi:hypothetical protein